MKLATFTHQGNTRIGVVVDDAVVDLGAALIDFEILLRRLLRLIGGVTFSFLVGFRHGAPLSAMSKRMRHRARAKQRE